MVGLNTDYSVRSLKGHSRPYIPESERAQMLAALEDVSYVVLFDDLTPLELIKALQPDVLIKGEDWKDAGIIGKEIVESYGGKVIYAPLVKGISTTTIVSRIIARHTESQQ
ncbi:MAG: hypothetical protein HZB37_03075 [Planctomycetes bacterium]|nr:hypothetical protein [Planctomycetota bacterium]